MTTADTWPGVKYLGRFTPGSDEWHAARASGLGGSEIGAVLGVSPWESRFSLWHRKAGLIGQAEASPEMEWGTRLEPAILRKYADDRPGMALFRQNGTFASLTRPWQIANPDLLIEDRVVEAKFSLYGDGWGEDGTEEIPRHVRCQVMWYMDVLGLPQADVCVLIGGGADFRVFPIAYVEAEALTLRAEGEAFLATVAAGQVPDIDEHGATYQIIRELHPDIDDEEVDVPNDLAKAFIRTKAEVKAAEARAQLATSRLADLMGRAKTAKWDGRVLARRQSKKAGVPYVVAGRNLPTPEELDDV